MLCFYLLISYSYILFHSFFLFFWIITVIISLRVFSFYCTWLLHNMKPELVWSFSWHERKTIISVWDGMFWQMVKAFQYHSVRQCLSRELYLVWGYPLFPTCTSTLYGPGGSTGRRQVMFVAAHCTVTHTFLSTNTALSFACSPRLEPWMVRIRWPTQKEKKRENNVLFFPSTKGASVNQVQW